MFKRILVLAALSILLIGCPNFGGSKNGGEAPVKRSPIKGSLLAQVNDWAVGTVDFREKLDALKTIIPAEEGLREQFEDPETQKRILQELVNFEILAQVAESKGMGRENDVMDAVKNFKRNFLAQKMLGEIYKDITITSVEIENFYSENKGLFSEAETRKIREIVVTSEAQAKDIMIRLLQGENFSSLARSYSIAPTKSKGGDLGNLKIDERTTREKKFPNFWRTAVTTDEGKASSYFKSPDGRYYIIQVDKVKRGDVRPLSEVRGEIEEHLKGVQANVKKEDIIANAKEKFKVIINQDLLK